MDEKILTCCAPINAKNRQLLLTLDLETFTLWLDDASQNPELAYLMLKIAMRYVEEMLKASPGEKTLSESVEASDTPPPPAIN
jgi:hypothetical protein